MPRNNKKKSGHHQAAAAPATTNGSSYLSDDELSNDNESIYSYQSDQMGSLEDAKDGDDSSFEATALEKFEERLLQALETATEKNAAVRTAALQQICELLMARCLPEFVEERKMTIMDLAERGVKRGKGAEQAWAARLAAVLIVQLGGDEEVTRTLSPLLLTTALDNAVSFDARAKCCMALGLLNFLGNDDLGEISTLMKSLETIFAGSYLKGDNSPSSAGTEAAALHSAALSAWALLLTLLPAADVVSLIQNAAVRPSVRNLLGMLESAHLDVRMVAGEALALVLEAGRAHDEDFLEETLPALVDAARKLATDSHKFRAKRDRKTQRATFRDVLHYLEEDLSPEISVRFGAETLLLDTWTVHHQYTALCGALGSGMPIHLAENELLRDVLALGPRLAADAGAYQRMSKAEKRFINAASFKARTKSRAKNRDKRSAVVT